MVLNDLLYDGKADAASALAGISRGIRPVETLENIRKLFFYYGFAVVRDLHLDKVTHIQDPDIDDPILFIHVF